jgi:hypothetical protein
MCCPELRRIRPEIVGWSSAPRGHVINKSLGQVPKKLVAGARVLARTESSPPNRVRNRVDHRTITGRSHRRIADVCCPELHRKRVDLTKMDPSRTSGAVICCAAQPTCRYARLRSFPRGGSGETASGDEP